MEDNKLLQSDQDYSSEKVEAQEKTAWQSPMDDKKLSPTGTDRSEETKPPKKKRKSPAVPWKKPHDMPKRPLSAYNLFFKDERARLISAGPRKKSGETKLDETKSKEGKPEGVRKHVRATGIGFANLAKIIATKWNDLSEEEKAPYESKASTDKERYDIEVTKWREEQKKKKAEEKKQLKLKSKTPAQGLLSIDTAFASNLNLNFSSDQHSIGSFSDGPYPQDWFETSPSPTQEAAKNFDSDRTGPPSSINATTDESCKSIASALTGQYVQQPVSHAQPNVRDFAFQQQQLHQHQYYQQQLQQYQRQMQDPSTYSVIPHQTYSQVASLQTNPMEADEPFWTQSEDMPFENPNMHIPFQPMYSSTIQNPSGSLFGGQAMYNRGSTLTNSSQDIPWETLRMRRQTLPTAENRQYQPRGISQPASLSSLGMNQQLQAALPPLPNFPHTLQRQYSEPIHQFVPRPNFAERQTTDAMQFSTFSQRVQDRPSEGTLHPTSGALDDSIIDFLTGLDDK